MPRQKKPRIITSGICSEKNRKDLVGEYAYCVCGNVSQVTSEKQINYKELTLVIGERKETAKGWPCIECPECGLTAYINPPHFTQE